MKSKRVALGVAFMAGLLPMLSSAVAFAEDKTAPERTVDLNSLPAPVQAAINKATHGAKIEEIEAVVEGGVTEYSVEASRLHLKFEVTFSAAGTITDFELQDVDGEEDDDAESQDKAKPSEAARGALQDLAGAGETLSIKVEKENGVPVFEGAWGVEGAAREAVVTAAGDVVEQEQQISFASLPAPVQLAATKLLPSGAEPKVELKTVTLYEVEVEIAGKEKEWLFSATGQQAEIQLDKEHEQKHEHQHDNH